MKERATRDRRTAEQNGTPGAPPLEAPPARPTASARRLPWFVARWSRADVALVTVLLAVAVFQFATLDGGQDWGGDWAHYVLHAKNIATGAPYAETDYVFNRKFFLAPEVYPPGLPLLLAPIYALFGLNIYLMKGLMGALFLASIGVTLWMLRGDLPRGQLAALAALLGFSPFLWKLSHQILSDVPFLLWVSLSLWSIRRMHAARRRPLAWAAGAGLFVYAAVITRPLGPVLILSVLALDLMRTRRITRQTGLLLGVCLLCYGAHELIAYAFSIHAFSAEEARAVGSAAAASDGHSELIRVNLLGRISQLPMTVATTVTDYLRHALALWHNGYAQWPTRILAAFGFLAAAVGWGGRAWEQLSILEVFCALYVAALLPWTFSMARYLLPVIPLYFFYVLVGAGQLQAWLARRWQPLQRRPLQKPWAAGLLVGAALCSYGASYAALPPRTLPTDPTEPAAQRFFAYVRTHTPPDAVFIFRRPRTFALYTGRPTATYRDAGNKPASDEKLLRDIEQMGARYVVEGPPDEPRAIQDLARQYPDRLALVHEETYFKLYRLTPGS